MQPEISVIPIVGTTRRVLKAGRTLHTAPKEDVMSGLGDDLSEIADGPWYACIFFSDGLGALFGQSTSSRAPREDVQQRMIDLTARLNQEAHHNGHWVTLWFENRLCAAWRAQVTHKDGSKISRLVLECTYDEPWERVRAWSVEEMMDRAEAMYRTSIDFYRAA